MHSKLTRVGLNENDCSVFLFKGMGYWVCPPFFNVSIDSDDVVRIGYLYKEPGHKRISRVLHLNDPAQVLQTIGEIADIALEEDGFILTKVIRRQWFNPKKFTLAKVQNRRYYRTRIPVALQDVFPSEMRSKEVTEENKLKRLVEISNIHKRNVQYVLDHMTQTKEQALTFHKENPIKGS